MSRLVVSIGHVEFTGGSQVLYVVKVQQDADEWEVRRTYSDFRKLRDDVQRVMKDARAHILDDACSREFARELQDLPFPAKRLFGSKKDHVVKERAVELHRFLIKLLFLTHTYRKAQKARYDQYVQALPTHQQAAYAALQDRTQASVSVFYLLRDFLKPITMKTGVPAHAGDLLGSSNGGTSTASGATNGNGDDSDDSPRRLIRESKILAMRHSNSSERKKKQASSIRQEAEKLKRHHQQQQQQQQHYQHVATAVPVPTGDSHSEAAVVAGEDPTKEMQDTSTLPHATLAPQKDQAQSSGNGAKTVNMSDLVAASARSRAEANSLREQFLHQQHDGSGTHAHRKHRHYSTPNGETTEWKGRTERAVTSASAVSSATSAHDDSDAEKFIVSSSVPSSASSSTSVDDVKLVDVSYLSASKDKDKKAKKKEKTSRSGSHTGNEKTHKSRSKKSAMRNKRKAQSAKNLHLAESERLSRLSTQLTAQAVSVNAQHELEKYLSEYSAIMILRYVDRFINKAVMKSPGCYRVNLQNRLVIDSERFLEELEGIFTDLPDNFGEMFRGGGGAGDAEDWGFPKSLDRYVQMKWNSFQQGLSMSSSMTNVNSSGSIADMHHTSGSDDDSDTEYEYEETTGGGGYMTMKRTISNDEESMLQEMIANGTAGREQMLRLRRQNNEQGWNRRENPGSRSQRVVEDDDSSDSDSDDNTRRRQRAKRREVKKSASCVVERYQQEQNARRKDRLSRVQSIGGLV